MLRACIHTCGKTWVQSVHVYSNPSPEHWSSWVLLHSHSLYTFVARHKGVDTEICQHRKLTWQKKVLMFYHWAISAPPSHYPNNKLSSPPEYIWKDRWLASMATETGPSLPTASIRAVSSSVGMSLQPLRSAFTSDFSKWQRSSWRQTNAPVNRTAWCLAYQCYSFLSNQQNI